VAGLAAVTALTFAVTGPIAGGTPASAASKDPKITFTVGLLRNADSLNPFLGITAPAYEMWALMYDYMIGYNLSDMAPNNTGLATSWDTSPDGKTWTFHIRTGVKWSDGKPLTAHDIAYTYNRILHGTTEATTWSSYLQSVTSVTAPNDTTVVLTLSKPNAVLPLLPIPILPEHVWKHISEQQVKSYPNNAPVVGSGPFRIVQGSGGASLYRFVANKHYWQGAPNIDEVDFRIFQAEDPAVQALKTGEIDFLEDISVNSINALKGNPNITTHIGDSPGFDEIAFNTGSVDPKTGKPIGNPNPAVLDPAFRRAIAYAVDNKTLIAKVYEGAGKPGTTIIPPAYTSYHWQPPPGQAYTFDPAKAKRLLDQAGYKMGAGGFRDLPNGKPIGQLRLFARSGSDTSTKTMEYLQEWLSSIGIDSKVVTIDENKLTQTILEGNYDLFQWGWYVEPDPDSMLSYMTCGARGGWSDSWYCNKTYDRLYTQQHAEMNQAKREAMVKRMQQILYRDVPYIVTAYSSIGEAYRSDRFTGFKPQPDPGGVYLEQYGVYNYIHVKPVAGASSSGNSGNGLMVGGAAVGGVLVLGLIGWALLRRREAAVSADRE
jgi:peptide/nickel transport system substrate-binding protein